MLTQPEGGKSVAIAVAAHKPYWMPQDPIYVPVQVGASGKPPIEGFARDDAGENISRLNPRYCELTALYWADRNLGAEYVGLAHYRRHFAGCGERGTLTGEEALRLLREAPVILPKRRNYYVETLASHYAHTFDATHLKALRDSLAKVSPEYLAAYDAHLAERGGHMFNMMVMRRDLLDSFVDWMFPVLFEVERRIDFSGMSPFEERLMGRLSELLVDVWINKNDVPYVERPVVGMERTNWLKKGGSFLAAKFLGKKYGESF